MKTKIYACYGISGHELEAVYSVTPSDVCDEIIVEIPESLKPYVTMTGSIAVMLPAPKSSVYKTFPYTLEEVLFSTNDGRPAIKVPGYYCNIGIVKEDC